MGARLICAACWPALWAGTWAGAAGLDVTSQAGAALIGAGVGALLHDPDG